MKDEQYCIDIKYIHGDNARENKALQQHLKNDGLKIQFEFTAPDTPQQNGIVEHAFPTLMGHTKTMMNYAGFNKYM